MRSLNENERNARNAALVVNLSSLIPGSITNLKLAKIRFNDLIGSPWRNGATEDFRSQISEKQPAITAVVTELVRATRYERRRFQSSLSFHPGPQRWPNLPPACRPCV